MASKAQLEANARYLSKKKSIIIRLDPNEYKAIQDAADITTNGSVQGYVIKACKEKIERDLNNNS